MSAWRYIQTAPVYKAPQHGKGTVMKIKKTVSWYWFLVLVL